jgi:hypothetical protein
MRRDKEVGYKQFSTSDEIQHNSFISGGAKYR